MFRRLLAGTAGCVIGLLAGCDNGNGAATRGESDFGPLESYRAGAGFDPAKRVFVRNDVPRMPTAFHAEYVEDFITMPGFGGGRMIVIPRTQSEWSELVPESEDGRTFEALRTVGVPHAQPDVLSGGYDPVHESMKLPDGSVRAVREQVWVVKDWQLMSVNAETGPAVYLIDTKGRHVLMRAKVENFDGKTAPKRPPTEFETAALAKLRDGDDLVLQSSSKEMRVLGAVRARQDCLSCHKVEVGDLLGAFTYKLTLQPQETPEAHRLKDLAGLSQDERSAVQTVESLGGRVTREPGGPITELHLTFARSQFLKTPRIGVWGEVGNPYVRLRDGSLNVLAMFPDLTVLDVSHSLVTDASIPTIATLKRLKQLDVLDTAITEAGLARLKKEMPGCQVRHQSTGPILP